MTTVDFRNYIETYSDLEVDFPLLENGKIDEKAIKSMIKDSREDKIRYCILSNRIFERYIFKQFYKLSDESLDREVEYYNYLWDLDS